MAVRNGQQYLDSLDGLGSTADIWISGHKVEDVRGHAAFSRPATEIARLYDMQVAPETREALTYEDENGERHPTAFLVPRGTDDLKRRGAAFRTWAEATFGMMGRSPDFLNVTLTTLATAEEFYSPFPDWFENVKRYQRFVLENDLFLTHALINPQADRSQPSHGQEDPFLHLGVVEETSEGLLVRGAKLLATLAPLANELIVYPFPGIQPGDERYALAFAIPIATPGLRLICREPVGATDSTPFDHPLGSRFEEPDAVVIFKDVIIPWDRVFLYGDVGAANGFYPRTGLWQHPAHQTSIRGLVKLGLVSGVALQLADAVGVDGFLHVQKMLGDLVEDIQTITALISHSEETPEIRADGEYLCNRDSLQTVRGLLPKLYGRAVETVQILGAGGLMIQPTHADIMNPDLHDDIGLYYRGRPGVDANDRIALFKLAWDLVGDGFGQRQLQYERYYAGDPMRLVSNHWRAYDKTELNDRVQSVIDQAKQLTAQMIQDMKGKS